MTTGMRAVYPLSNSISSEGRSITGGNLEDSPIFLKHLTRPSYSLRTRIWLLRTWQIWQRYIEKYIGLGTFSQRFQNMILSLPHFVQFPLHWYDTMSIARPFWTPQNFSGSLVTGRKILWLCIHLDEVNYDHVKNAYWTHPFTMVYLVIIDPNVMTTSTPLWLNMTIMTVFAYFIQIYWICQKIYNTIKFNTILKIYYWDFNFKISSFIVATNATVYNMVV